MSRAVAQRIEIQPRVLSKGEAAAYCGAGSISSFDDWVRRRIIPGPIPGTHRWDRLAIDRALDAASGIKPDAEENPFLAWKASQSAVRA